MPGPFWVKPAVPAGKVPAAGKKPVAPKQPSQVRLAVRARRDRLARAVVPYLIPVAGAAVAVLFTRMIWPLYVASGASGWHALLRLHEGYGWHRRGGRAAARKRRRYQGTASAREIRRKLSVTAARRRAVITRPSLPRTRLLPAQEAGVVIGRGGRPKQVLMGTPEDFYLVHAGPRKGKTGWMSGVLADAPGFGLGSSTRVDMWAHTVIERERRGPVLTLNPGGDGGIPTTLAWDMLSGCAHPMLAIERAGYLMDAAPKDTSGKDAWWDHQGGELLRLMMHAGALAGATLRDVAAWVRDPSTGEPVSVLYGSPGAAVGWAGELAAICDQAGDDGEFLRNVSRSAVVALAWLADPAMAAVACPRPEDDLDMVQLLAEGGTMYLIGTDRPHGSFAPYYACLTAHGFDTAKRMASVSPGLRLDPPATLVIDEPAVGNPVPLARWSAEAGGHGITLVTGVQSPAQLARRWGEHDAKVIRDNATVTLIFGGHTDAGELDRFSAVCGDVDTWDRAPGGGKQPAPPRRLFPPERLRTLDEGTAVLLHRSARPVLAQITPVWERPGYQRAELPGLTASPAAPARPALPAPAPSPVIPAGGEPALEPAPDHEEICPLWPQDSGTSSGTAARPAT